MNTKAGAPENESPARTESDVIRAGNRFAIYAGGAWLFSYLAVVMPSLVPDAKSAEARKKVSDQYSRTIQTLKQAIKVEKAALPAIPGISLDALSRINEDIEEEDANNRKLTLYATALTNVDPKTRVRVSKLPPEAKAKSADNQQFKQTNVVVTNLAEILRGQNSLKRMANYRERVVKAAIENNLLKEERRDKTIDVPLFGKVSENRILAAFPVFTAILLLGFFHFRARFIIEQKRIESPPLWAFPLAHHRTSLSNFRWWAQNTAAIILVGLILYVTIHCSFVHLKGEQLSPFESTLNVAVMGLSVGAWIWMLISTIKDDTENTHESNPT